MKFFDTSSQQGQKRPIGEEDEDEDDDLSMNPPPAKRPFQPTTSQSQFSPDVQVCDFANKITLEMQTDPNRLFQTTSHL